MYIYHVIHDFCACLHLYRSSSKNSSSAGSTVPEKKRKENRTWAGSMSGSRVDKEASRSLNYSRFGGEESLTNGVEEENTDVRRDMSPKEEREIEKCQVKLLLVSIRPLSEVAWSEICSHFSNLEWRKKKEKKSQEVILKRSQQNSESHRLRDQYVRYKMLNNHLSDRSQSGGGRGLFSFFKSLTAGRTITRDSMAPVMEKMKEHLIS